jgi:hypothetical protein
MIKIISTKNYGTGGVKVLTYGPAGIGKTRLCATAPNPFIISAEGGLLSLREYNIPAVEITSVDGLNEAYKWVTESEEAKQFETICLDSITDIAEVLLSEYKKDEKDPRQAYGRLNDDMAEIIRSFRDLKGKHVYFTAKQTKFTDEKTGITSYLPGMPGKTLLNGLSFFFDEVFCMRVGQLEDGTLYKYLQTYTDFQYDAKDRSGSLPPKMKPDLTDVFNRISKGPKETKGGETKKETETEIETETKTNE